MGKKAAQSTLKLARDSLKGTNTIYAIEKDGTVHMLKISFDSYKELRKEAASLNKQGYKVRYTHG